MLIAAILCFFLPYMIYCDSLYDDGLEQFLYNNPREAAALFQLSLQEGNTEEDVFIYLAYTYEQLGFYDQSISTLQDGLNYAEKKRDVFYFNLGNLHVYKKEFHEAIEYFNLAIKTQSLYAEAYLNRANAQLQQQNFPASLSDYRTFINIVPDHRLVPVVRRMIEAMSAEMLAAETRKMEEERLAALEAERRRLEALEAEQRAQEEELRRHELLNSILGSLNTAGEEGNTLGAGTEEISNTEDDFMRAE